MRIAFYKHGAGAGAFKFKYLVRSCMCLVCVLRLAFLVLMKPHVKLGSGLDLSFLQSG